MWDCGKHVLAYAKFGLLVVTSTDENRTRPDFTSAWKECPPGVNSGYVHRSSNKKTHRVCFFVGTTNRAHGMNVSHMVAW
jgi:hypothetical protein